MRVFRRFSTRISLYVILLTAALFLTASVTVYKINYDMVRKEAVTNAFSQLRALNLEMENVLSSVASAINNMVPRAEIMAAESRDTSDFLLLLKDVLKNTPQLKDVRRLLHQRRRLHKVDDAHRPALHISLLRLVCHPEVY